MKLNGYRPAHRNRWSLLRKRILSAQAFLLLEYLIDQMDFDPRHEKYGTVLLDIKEIQSVFGRSASNTIRNWCSQLVKSGLIELTEKKRIYHIPHPERYIAENFAGVGRVDTFTKQEKDQPIEELLQSIAPQTQLTELNVQPVEQIEPDYQTNRRNKALGSFKVESNISSATSPLNALPGTSEFKYLTDDDTEYLNSREYFERLHRVDNTPIAEQVTVADMSISEIREALQC